ncbi:MAG: hypothetical protein MUC49_07415 [Raineya sp.]|jgi:hypothetical protein|nr:hypothetical protein [Raineya sp.]
MKKALIIIFLCLLNYTSSFAQIAQGTKWLSGSINFSSKSDDTIGYNFDYKTKHQSFSFSPIFGYFIKENQLLGIGAIYSQFNYSENYDSNLFPQNNGSTLIKQSKYNLYGTQILYRKYFPLSSKFYVAAEGNASIRIGKKTQTPPDFAYEIFDVKSNIIQSSLSGKAILVYFFTRKFSTEMNIGSLNLNYNSTKGSFQQRTHYYGQPPVIETIKFENQDINVSSSFFFNNISLGFQFYF